MTFGRALVALGTFAGALSQWIVVLLVARLVGPAELGVYSTLLAYATPLYVVGFLALRDIYLSIARRPPFRYFMVLRCLGLAIASFALILIGAFNGWPKYLVVALVVLKVAGGINDLLVARVQAQEKTVQFGAAITLNAVISTVAMVLVLLVFQSLAWALAASAVVTVLISVTLAYVHDSYFEAPARPPVAPYASLLRASVPLTFAQLLSSLLISVPIYFMQGAGHAEVGRYSGAAYLVTFGNLVGASIAAIIIPAARRLQAESGPAAVNHYLRRLELKLTLWGAAALGVVVAFGDPVLTLIYGPEFAIGVPSLLALGLAALAAPLGYVTNLSLLVSNQYWKQVPVVGVALAAAVGAGFVLTWLGVGAVLTASLVAMLANVARAVGFHVASRWGHAAGCGYAR